MIPAAATGALTDRAFPISAREGSESRPEAIETPALAGGLRRREIETAVPIQSEADIVLARQHGRALAARLGFARTEATLVATAISELARNIILYAGRGSIVLKTIQSGKTQGMLVIVHDDGPGIADPSRALAGGYSTSGGLGLGLCGVRRLVDEFDLATEPGRGTTVTFRKWRA